MRISDWSSDVCSSDLEITGAVLSVGARETLAESADTELVPADRAIARTGDVVYMTDPLARPDVLPGRSYKLRWPESDHAIYITLNDLVQEGAGKEPRRRPFEIFIKIGRASWRERVCRYV